MPKSLSMAGIASCWRSHLQAVALSDHVLRHAIRPGRSPGPLTRGTSDHFGRLCVFGHGACRAASPVPCRPGPEGEGYGGWPVRGRIARFPLALPPEGHGCVASTPPGAHLILCQARGSAGAGARQGEHMNVWIW